MSTLLHGQTNPLAYTPVDAQYSTVLDRIVMVSANPNQLHVYNPVTQTDVQVGLPKPPLSVSVSPDGMYAAVGHDALVSYVNLATASIVQTYGVSFTVQTVVLGESWIYVLAPNVVSIDIATGAVTTGNSVYDINGGRLDAALNAIYAVGENGFVNFDVSTGPIAGQTSSSYYPYHQICGSVWLSPDGSRLYDGCATVFNASATPTLDMRYLTTLNGTPSVGALTTSAALQQVALIQNSSAYPTGNDGMVTLSGSNYLQPIGQFVLSGFTAGGASLTPHGKWIFFNSASTNIFVVIEGQTSSGTIGGFAVQTFSLAPPSPCGAAFAPSTAPVAASGSLGTAGVTAAATCIYQATSNASWLQVVSGGYGSGNGTLTYIARANPTASQRVGTISIAGQTLTVTQAGAAAPGTFTQLAYNIVDSSYDGAADMIIFAAANPNELHIYNPATQADHVVPLSIPPLCLSVQPGGAYAAVGHQGWVSYVNLQTGAVDRIFTIGTDATYAVLAGNGYLYLFPNNDDNVYSLQLSTGTETPTSYYESGPARLYADGQSIYQAGYSIAKWNISAGEATLDDLSSTPGNCGNIWLSEDGLSLATACATFYTTSETPATDLQYEGTLSNAANSLVWAAESEAISSTAVIPTTNYQSPANDTQVQMYGDAYLDYAGTLPLPQFTVGGTAYAGHGKFAFWNNAGSSLYIVEQADGTAKLLSSFAVDNISPSSSGSGCTFTLGSNSANEPAGLGFDSVTVTTGASCVWTASSNSSWLTITAGAFGFGSADLAFSFTANSASTTRTAVLTIAGQTFTVTQAAGTASVYSLSGQVTYAGKGLNGINILLSTGATVATDGSGNYSFGNLAAGGNYTVAPLVGDYSFSPPDMSFADLSGNQTANFQANVQYDFNGGPGPDVIWQNPQTGAAQVWYLGGTQGTNVTGAANLALGSPWRIVGVADFDGDGTPDVVWQDPVSGAVQVWFLGGSGGNVIGGAANITSGNSWRVVSVADFNRDGHPDLLWQDPVSGFSQIWYMGGTQGVTLLGAATIDSANTWQIAGSADFNGDGFPDVLWQDPESGTVQIWYMGGTQAGAEGSVVQSAANLAASPWHVVAIADFNLDGHPDVVFQDPVSGSAQVFFYTGAQGTTPSGAAVLSGPNPWIIAGPH
jgi:hypothetical protein